MSFNIKSAAGDGDVNMRGLINLLPESAGTRDPHFNTLPAIPAGYI
jgi:hypothetical protein